MKTQILGLRAARRRVIIARKLGARHRRAFCYNCQSGLGATAVITYGRAIKKSSNYGKTISRITEEKLRQSKGTYALCLLLRLRNTTLRVLR